jgi:hypothetical protein
MILVGALFAQDTEVKVGDTLYFSECSGENYTYIDYYAKTRQEEDSTDYRQLEGWEFYYSFFGKGDFDVTRLPCSHQNSYAVIKHIMQVEDSDKNWHTVVMALMEDELSAAYLIEEAFAEEVLLAAAE